MQQFIFKNKGLPYLLVLPQFLIVVIFILYPTFQSLKMSLFLTSVFSDEQTFVGLRNFVELFVSSDYLRSIQVSLIFSGSVTVFGLGISLLISTVVERNIRGVSVYRTALIWPYALSPAVTGAIWMFLTHPSYGILTYLLHVKLNWILNGAHALVLISVAAVWRMLGYNIAFYIAGLQAIPLSIKEAADLDGANAFQKFARITFPLLSPTTFFLLTMNLVYSFFETFGLIHTVTQGGPAGMTEIMVYRAYKDGFINLIPDLSAAQSVILLVLCVGIITLQFKYIDRRVHYGA
jgi:sn-glycerol 3-phosphate transport system permease protein